MRLAVCLCVVLLSSLVDARRSGGGGSRWRGGSTRTKPRNPPPSPRTDTSSSSHFLNFERGSSSSSGATHNTQPAKPSIPSHTNGPVGFERFGSSTNQGNQKLGFDKVNSEVQNKPVGSHTPSAPPFPGGSNVGSNPQYPGATHVGSNPQYPGSSHVPSAPQYPGGSHYPGSNSPNGPPPAYYPGTHSGNGYSGVNDHPPAYPGRPVNAPPTYSASNPQYGQANPGFGTNFAGQPHTYQSQTYPSQQHFGSNFGNTYPQQNQMNGVGHGSFPSFGGSYPGNTGYNPGYSGNSFGGGSPFGSSYQGNSYGGSPFGGSYNGNPHYSPGNFGYSSNPGYFGQQGNSGYPGQYGSYQQKSRFGGLPIPIPIPIPIPFGGGGFGGFGNSYGYGAGRGSTHRLLDTFIKSNGSNPAGNSSTSVFILNNSTVTPCTTDHFVYDLLRVSVVSCTAEFCTAIKVYTTTNVSNVVSVHSAGFTVCLENNVTVSQHGDNISPTVSEVQNETLKFCRDVPNNLTVSMVNSTTKSVNESAPVGANTTTTDATSTTVVTTTEAPTTTDATTTAKVLLNSTISMLGSNSSKICESVNCSRVEMCLPAIEIVDQCNSVDCPFRRTGYKTCVQIKMCRSPSAPVSSFASINTTISKIDEYNHHNSVYDAANLTLISYHRPIISFNCSHNTTSPGCPPPPANVTQTTCIPNNSTQPATSPSSNATLCSTPTPLTTPSKEDAVATTQVSSPPPP